MKEHDYTKVGKIRGIRLKMMTRDKQKTQHANHYLVFIVVLDIILNPFHNYLNPPQNCEVGTIIFTYQIRKARHRAPWHSVGICGAQIGTSAV